jgi:6-phosphogluconolactonase (cycloisomerase 2 family)
MTGFGRTSPQAVTMKIKIGAVLLAAAAFVAGCSGFWTLPPSTSTTTTTPTTLSSGVFYVLNQTTGQIVAYKIVTGSLTTIGTYPITGPTAIAIAPNGDFLYVSTLTNGIFVYNIGSGGALTLGNNNRAISSDPALALQVASNSWLIDTFVNASGQVQMDAIPLDSSGTYTSGANVPAAYISVANPTVKQMVLSPKGDYLFLALGSGGAVAVPFSSGSSSPFGSTATTISAANSQQAALSVAVDPTERLFYVGKTNADSAGTSGGLLAFSYSSLTSGGALTQISGSPIASGGGSPSAILPEASGDYVYVANGQGETGAGNITWFPITASATTYSITSGSDIASGVFPFGLAEDSDDNFVLAVSTGGTTSSGDPDLEAFTMSSGALTAAVASKTGTDPVGAVAIAALP